MRLTLPPLRAFALALVLGGCARAGAPGPGQATPEGERHRAALALLTVQNATTRRLRIAFRPASGPGNDVVVGTVDAAASATMAPLLAGEPIVLSAIAEDSSRFTLPARSFELGEHWTWHVPADAAFAPPRRGP